MRAALLPMQQGSPEWHAHRARFRNASETPALMDRNPWFPKTPIQLARVKRGLDTVQYNAAMRRGHELEPIIRAQLEDMLDDTFEPCVMVDGDYSASLDGHNLAGDTDLEIKAPSESSPTWEAVRAQRVPDHYLWQVQHQLMVSHAKRCIFAVGDGNTTPITVEVKADRMMHEAIRRAWDEFWPLMECDESELVEVVMRDDAEWRCAVDFYRAAKADADRAGKDADIARERLIALSGDVTSEGCGIRCIRAERAGSVNYRHKDIKAALAWLNLDEYRGVPTQYWTIKEVGSDGNRSD